MPRKKQQTRLTKKQLAEIVKLLPEFHKVSEKIVIQLLSSLEIEDAMRFLSCLREIREILHKYHPVTEKKKEKKIKRNSILYSGNLKRKSKNFR